MSGCGLGIEEGETGEDSGGTGEVEAEEQVDSVLSYFPIFPRMVYNFAGEGIEYAAFNRRIIHVEKSDENNENNDGNYYVQFHDETTGTIVANIYRLGQDQVSLIYQEPEFYTEENLIEKIDVTEEKEEDIILKAPLEEGGVWETETRRREIVAIGEEITTEAGDFHDVIKIKVENLEQENSFITYEYYAKNIGLIKRLNIGEDDYEIRAELERFGLEEVEETE